MKKTIKNIGKFLMLLILVSSCQDDDQTFGDLTAPSNLQFDYQIVGQDGENPNGDGSGNVLLKATADNAVSYKFIFEDGSSTTVSGGEMTKKFTTNGVNSYEVTVVAQGKGGVATSGSFMVEDVLSNFSDPLTKELLTGGSSKIWYWAAGTPGHLGVGPNTADPANNYFPAWYSAAPWEKAGSPTSSCLYENKLTFSLDGDIIKFTLENNGNTFHNAAYTGGAGSDQCLPLDTSGEKTVLLEPSASVVAGTENTTGTQMTFTDNGFMGYFIGTSTYEVLSISETTMMVRAVQGSDAGLAWYHIFTTQQPVQGGDDPDFADLIWSDEFDVAGAPNPDNWTMETGTGVNGWGNNEKQFYRSENAVVEGGVLKITAKREDFGGMEYTSARMITKDKFEFKYGKVEIRAKLPSGGGTWPALWMLGANFDEVGWPASGEIDIMEHVGNEPGEVSATLHMPGNSGGAGITGSTTVDTFDTEFHVYSVEWGPSNIKFFVDGTEFHSFANSASTPFNANFFLILNIAMGGNLGGIIDPAFTQSTMEVDYIKVYQ